MGIFRDNANITASPDRGVMAMTDGVDYFPGAPDDWGFIGPDPDTPAVPSDADNLPNLLKQIRDRLPTLGPAEVFEVRVSPALGAVAGEIAFSSREGFSHLFVSQAPRVIDVYAGIGRTLFLGTVPVGKSLRAELPYTETSVTIVFPTGTATDQLRVFLSSKKIDVEII